MFGIRTVGQSRAWPLEVFEGGQVINDKIGATPLVLIGDIASRTVRAYDSGGRNFTRGDTANTVQHNNETWQVTEDAITGPDGTSLPRVPGHIAYWFA